jgi:transcription termination/antitermination protein NusG
VLKAGLAATPWPFLRVGDRVLIDRGPLAGIEGSLIEAKKSLRLVISIELLQRSIAAEVDRSWVRPINASKCTGLPGR